MANRNQYRGHDGRFERCTVEKVFGVQTNPDTVLAVGVPEYAYRLPFWSCQNVCKYYDTCTEE